MSKIKGHTHFNAGCPKVATSLTALALKLQVTLTKLL